MSQRFDLDKPSPAESGNEDFGANDAFGVSPGNRSPGGIGAGSGQNSYRKVPSDFRSIITPTQSNNAIFASKTNRFILNKQEISESPPPGTYNVAPSWNTAKGILPVAPSTTQSILKPLGISPGPGDYDIAIETSVDRAKRRNRKNILVSSSDRFQERKEIERYNFGLGRKGTGPGPGDYNPRDSSILKPSHNALMNPELFA